MNIQDQVLSLEASKAIVEFLGEGVPESLFYWCEAGKTSITRRSVGCFLIRGIDEIEKDDTPRYTFQELVCEVLPLIAEKMYKSKPAQDCFMHDFSGNIFCYLKDIGMSAVSERVISLMKE